MSSTPPREGGAPSDGQPRSSAGPASLLAPGSTTPIPPFLAIASLRIALTAFCLGCLSGIALPRAISLLYASTWQKSSAAPLLAWRVWGAAAGEGEAAPLQVWQRPQLHFYLLAWSLFHLLEFVITARWNKTRLYSDSFLIQNGVSYHLAHLFGITEFLVEAYVWPSWKQCSIWTCIGIAILAFGQIVRSLAMIHAADNFSHEVASHKRPDHELVTDGIYSITRHPSYFGFFYWAMGTQIALANPVSTLVFAIVLWRFFNRRIKGEEAYLVSFFGEQYVAYRRQTSTLIPFIR